METIKEETKIVYYKDPHIGANIFRKEDYDAVVAVGEDPAEFNSDYSEAEIESSPLQVCLPKWRKGEEASLYWDSYFLILPTEYIPALIEVLQNILKSA